MDGSTSVNLKDIYLVAALMSRGVELKSWSRDEFSNKIVFSLEGANLVDLQREWLSSTMMVNAITYKENIQKVKAILFMP